MFTDIYSALNIYSSLQPVNICGRDCKFKSGICWNIIMSLFTQMSAAQTLSYYVFIHRRNSHIHNNEILVHQKYYSGALTEFQDGIKVQQIYRISTSSRHHELPQDDMTSKNQLIFSCSNVYDLLYKMPSSVDGWPPMRCWNTFGHTSERIGLLEFPGDLL